MRCVGLLLGLVLLDGCIYTRGNLEVTKEGYKNYPSSIEAEQARRRRRRRNALIAAPLEIVGGLAITALAIYAPSSPSDADSTSGALADAGKELLGRLLLATGGMAIAVSGIGDGVLGATDPLFGSPLVRNGRLVPVDEIDTIAPPATPRFAIHSTTMIGTDGIGFDTGFGFSHWIGSNVRLRHAASAELTLPFDTADRRLIASAETSIERAFGRDHAGLYPKRSIGMYVAGGWAAIEDRPDAPVLRAGLAFGGRSYSYRLGTTYMAGDRRPSIDLGMRMELRTD
jgi:hypothetical protein